ncbi:MAG TPA: FAD-dependent oxidoreductase [Nocardioides sp.]|nr:FAD-dependent oxidoreductase [Nocardioides sp.]
MPERLVVVGASLAGVRAVEAARRRGFTGEIVLVGAEDRAPYDRPPLSKAVLAADGPTEPPTLRTVESLRDELGVDLRLGTPASGLDTGGRVVLLGDEEVRYDALVIATGATARTLPGSEDIGGVHTVRTAADAAAVRTALDAGARTVVVGAGFIGSEVASAARSRGLPVTVVEAADVPLTRAVGEQAGAVLVDLHRAAGTDLRLGVGVAGLETRPAADGTHRVAGVRLTDGCILPADLVVVGIGGAPATGWLRDSGLTLHPRDGGVVCDATLGTGAPGVYAAGDVAHWPNPLFARDADDLMRLEHWTSAAEQGALAAVHALGLAEPRPLASVPYFWSDWYGHRVQLVGVAAADEVLRADRDTDRPLVLYRRGDRVVGALSVDRPAEIMKYRRLVAARAPWQDALDLAGAGVLEPAGAPPAGS